MDFTPRKQFLPFHERNNRWACIVAHRRAGKTLACVADLITRALATSRQHGRYAYIAPFYSQAKAAAWDYLVRLTEGVAKQVKQGELSVDLINGSRIRLFGADNPDALRGQYFDGVVLDEVGDMRESLWNEVVRPALSDRRGWAVFIGTPKGKNHFYGVYKDALKDPEWLTMVLRASETNILEFTELQSAHNQMPEHAYRQEYEADFDAPVQGAIYAKEVAQTIDDQRICPIPYDTTLKVNTYWDLGVSDSTVIIFVQKAGGEFRIIDYYECSGEGLTHYAEVLEKKKYLYGEHWAPHDIQVRELGSGRSRIEVARTLGIDFRIAPNVPVEEGIHAARMIFRQCWFERDKADQLIECLKSYRREYNDKMREFKDKPVHDWASHGADAFRYFALSARSGPRPDGYGTPTPRRRHWYEG